MSKILVIDDEKAIRNTLKDVLEYEKHEVSLAEDGLKGVELFSENTYDLVLCDIKMQKMDGIEVLQKIMEISTVTPVIMISGHGNIDTAVEAIKKGAFDFLEKPVDLNRLLITIRNATDKSTLITQTQVLKNKVSKMYEIVGESEAILRVKEMIDSESFREVGSRGFPGPGGVMEIRRSGWDGDVLFLSRRSVCPVLSNRQVAIGQGELILQ